MSVINLIPPQHADAVERKPEDVKYLVVHRIGYATAAEWQDKGYPGTVHGALALLADAGLVDAYQFFVEPGGDVYQRRRVLDVTPHARRFNKSGVGVAFLGDFRNVKPTPQQWIAGIELFTSLSLRFPQAKIVSHTELGPWATRWAGKKCPGKQFSMQAFRRLVKEQTQQLAVQQLAALGVVT